MFSSLIDTLELSRAGMSQVVEVIWVRDDAL